MPACGDCGAEMSMRKWVPHPCPGCSGQVGGMGRREHDGWAYRCGSCGWSGDQ